MGHRVAAAALFLLALAPSAWLAWRWRAMPQLGLHQDDALYLVGAKSLAEGRGYRIDSLPGSPFQTKYPPLVSVLMTPVWKLGPAFPQNLKLATLLAWLMLPIALLALRALFRQFDFGPRETCVLTLAAAWHPVLGLLSTAILSDLLFLALFAGCVWLAEKALQPGSGPRIALAAGLVAGLAFLTRTAALPIVITAPLCFAHRRRLRQGLCFLAGVLPAVGAWQAWSLTHMLHTRDPVLLYYTNYLAMQTATVRPANLAQVIWYNSDALLRSFGKLLVFDVALIQNIHLQRILGIAALTGAVRLVKRTGRVQYPAAACGIALLLLVYFFTSDERLSLPLFPLVLMGFWTEVKHFFEPVRNSWRRGGLTDRGAAAAAAAAAASILLFIAASYAAGYAVFLPRLYSACQRDLESHRAAYEWVQTRMAPQAILNAYDDPVLYLYTGRRALGMPMPSSRVYSGKPDREADQFVLDVPRRAAEHGLDHVLATSTDFYRENRAGLLWNAAKHDPLLCPEFTTGSAAVYRVMRPASSARLPQVERTD